MAKKKPLQTKNGFPILVEKKPKEKKFTGHVTIDPLKVYEMIGQSISNYKLDRIKKEDVVNSKHITVYDNDRNSSMYVAHACQLEQAQRDGRLPSYERDSKVREVNGKIQIGPGIKMPHYGLIKSNPDGARLYDSAIAHEITHTAKEFSKKFNNNNISGLFGMVNFPPNDDLIRVVKARKDFDDLFWPLKKVRVQQFREQIAKVFPDYDVAKVGSKIIATLKNYAYLKSLKGTDRKFIPDGDEIALIINASYIYDVAKFREQEPHTVLAMLHTGALKTLRKVTNSEVIKNIEQIEDLLNTLEHQSLDCGIMDEFIHYDIKIKFLRLLNEPRLDSLIENILRDIDGKLKFGYVDGKSDYDAGMFYINMIKKLGLRYISSRSNIEWLFYGSTLKKIRNFMSKDMYRAFVKVIAQNLEAYKQKEYDGNQFITGSNLWYVEKSLKVIDQLREKKFKNKRV